MFDSLKRRFGFAHDASIEAAQRLGLTQSAKVCATMLGHERQPAVATPWQQDILLAILGTLCDYQHHALPLAHRTGALETALRFLEQTPLVTREKLLDVLILFEAGATVLSPERTRFTRLSPEGQVAYMRQWEGSKVEVMCAAFQGLKSVCMIGYWSQPETWAFIDYDPEHTELSAHNDRTW